VSAPIFSDYVLLTPFYSQFTSEDPAPPLASSLLRRIPPSSTSDADADVPALTTTLLDPSLSLFVRYRALFTLRNTGTPTAIDALSSALLSPDEICSPLLKHEVAFVFGQMSDPHSVPALLKVLENDREAAMVRHEAAEALGGIATEAALPVLRRWATKEDAPRVVRESCVVAIDMWEVSVSPGL
jgi:deoxyhypusine monooxygenase